MIAVDASIVAAIVIAVDASKVAAAVTAAAVVILLLPVPRAKVSQHQPRRCWKFLLERDSFDGSSVSKSTHASAGGGSDTRGPSVSFFLGPIATTKTNISPHRLGPMP